MIFVLHPIFVIFASVCNINYRVQNEDIKIIQNSLNKKKKELNCIYNVDEILKEFNTSIDKVIMKLVDVIPLGWRFDDICKVNIKLYDFDISTKGFKRTELKQSANIFVEDKQVGEITICYIKPVRSEKGIFLPEENKLFKTIVEKINQYLAFRKLKDIYSENISNNTKNGNIQNSFISYLKKLELTDDDIAKITKVQINFDKGETVCKQGTFASFIMILKEGLLKAVIETSHYKNHIFKVTTPFSIVGLSSLYGDNYYHFSCRALINSTVYLIERSTFDQIIKNNTKFSMKIMKMYSSSLQNVYDKLGSVANKQAIGKVCDTLLYLSEKVFKSNIIETTITRKDIAELSGISNENLVRTLSELKKDNIISIKDKSIIIINYDTLKMLANIG